jgi:hypothetical protein
MKRALGHLLADVVPLAFAERLVSAGAVGKAERDASAGLQEHSQRHFHLTRRPMFAFRIRFRSCIGLKSFLHFA